MLNNRSKKDAVYNAFAQVTKAMSSPRRLELLDLLVQGPRSVEGLARATGQSMAGASQHLQVLKRARVVETTRRGTTIEYRLVDGVAEVFVALRRLALARSAELQAATEALVAQGEGVAVDRASLERMLLAGDVVLLDVRPAAEFAHAHVAGAVSIPLEELESRMAELPEDQLVVATCRGPWCLFASEAVELLRRQGREARRFDEGVAEWRAGGGAIGVGA